MDSPTEIEKTRCGILLVDSSLGVKLDLDDQNFLHMMRTEYPEFYHNLETNL